MTSTTRRSLLRVGALGLVLAPVLVAPEVFGAVTTRKDLYVRRRFAVLRHRTFRLEGAGRHWRARLTAVRNLPQCTKGSAYAFRRPGFKATTLFLVPSSDRRTYQAVIFRKP
jgi:hypothetical protein